MPAGSKNAPEARAREKIDRLLEEAGWTLQDRDDMNVSLPAVAVREFKLEKGHGYADYLLFLDGRAVGVCEAKPAGVPVRNVEVQAKKYVDGLPEALDAPFKPLPFAYISTGEETAFINHLDPHPRTREVFSFHRPETLREWLTADTLDAWVTGTKPADLIQSFRNSYFPRVAVTVDLIATGTDIKPVEIVIFMRSVKSRVLFEQMKGRGVRVINADELRAVTPDAKAKTHFLIVDCVGVCEAKLADTKPLEKNPSVSLKALLDHVAAKGTNDDYLSSLASRIARIDKQCASEDRREVHDVTGGPTLRDISNALVHALDADVQEQEARRVFGLSEAEEPTEEQLKKASRPLKEAAIAPLMQTPALRKLLLDLRQRFEQVVDEVSKDALIDSQTGYSAEAKEKAAALVKSFEAYLAEHKDEIDALQFFYSLPHKKRLRFKDIQKLADSIKAPPRAWTPEKLWRAYETLERSKVRGASAGRLLTDMVSLVRFALHQEGELVPHVERVQARFESWLAQQENNGRVFSDDQKRWLTMMRDHIATSLELEVDDFDLTPFTDEGGLAKASRVFGNELPSIVRELNEVLAA